MLQNLAIYKLGDVDIYNASETKFINLTIN